MPCCSSRVADKAKDMTITRHHGFLEYFSLLGVGFRRRWWASFIRWPLIYYACMPNIFAKYVCTHACHANACTHATFVCYMCAMLYYAMYLYYMHYMPAVRFHAYYLRYATLCHAMLCHVMSSCYVCCYVCVLLRVYVCMCRAPPKMAAAEAHTSYQ